MNERVKSQFVRDHFGIDYMDEVKWDMVDNSLKSAKHILANLASFPRADISYIEEQVLELELLLLARPIRINA